MRFFLLATAVFASLAFSQTEPPKKARLEGMVVSLTGEPIPRATIRLQGPQVSTATGDDAGNFAIENIEPGRNYQLSAQRPGYIAGRYGARSTTAPGSPLTLDAGAELKGLVITLTPQGVISGKITDQAGDAVQGAQVQVMRRGYQRGVRQFVTLSAVQSNDQGGFRVANLAPGRYYVAATDRGAVATSQKRDSANIPTFYPDATDAQAAVALDVGPGAELRGIDIRFRKGRMFSLRGKVDLAGAPPGPVTLTAQPKQISTVGVLPVQAAQARAPEYSFEVRNVVPGTYVVQGRMAQRLGSGIEVVVGDADVNGLLVTMGVGSSVTGTVTLEGGDIKALIPAGTPAATAATPVAVAAPVAVGTTYTIVLGELGLATGARPTIRLTSASGTLAGTAPLTPDGRFSIEGIPVGKYQLTLAPLLQGTYIKSARSGGQDVLHSGLEVTAGGTTVELVLGNKPAELTGAVRDDKAASLAGLMVTLWDKDFQPGLSTYTVRTAFTDQNGSFRFQGLPPGEYVASAWEDVEIQLLQSREFLAEFASEATKVTVAEGSHGSVEVKLVPIEKIRAAEAKLP